MALIWHAKPDGGYSMNSNEGIDNITCINGFLNSRGYTLEAQSGIIGNMIHESALNPWQWEYGFTPGIYCQGGYGLFQFTPAEDYFAQCWDVDGFAPNMSRSEVTANARPSDGYAHLVVFDEDLLSKWMTFCWRPGWDRTQYANLWEMRRRIIEEYGTDGGLTQAAFKNITNIAWATFAFLACYEGPGVPNFSVREQSALAVYALLSGDTPPPPTPPPGPGPGPTPTPGSNKIMFYLKPWWKRF